MTSDFWFLLIHGKIWAACRLRVPPPEESVPGSPPQAPGPEVLALLVNLSEEDTGSSLEIQTASPAMRRQPEPPRGAHPVCPQELLTLGLGLGSGKAPSCLGLWSRE